MRKLTMVAAAFAVTLSLKADKEKVGDYEWTYQINGDTAEIGNGGNWAAAVSPAPTGAITIPSTLGGRPVTGIGYAAFENCHNLMGVTIPDSVTSIGNYAFYNCSGLTDVSIGNGVTSIGWEAFSACSGLTSVTIPDSVTSIGDGAFADCTGLKSVTIPDSVTSIGWRVFDGCTGLTSVTIPDSVTSIGDDAFSGCTGLTSVTIPDSVTSIGYGAFYGCSGLTSVTIPDAVTSIGWRVFYGCSGLTSVTIGNGVTSIGGSAFYGCRGLTSVTIPDAVTSIGDDAFSGCSESLFDTTTIPGVKLLDGWAVDSTESLSDDLNLTGIRGIGEDAFSYCSGLTSVTILDSVTSIGAWAFSGCSGLTSVTIGNGVTSIGHGAFQSCTGLTSVTIPDSVTSIEASAFSYCSGLTSVTIGNGVTSIGNGVYAGTWDGAFYGCNRLTEVVFRGDMGAIDMDLETEFRDTPWLAAYTAGGGGGIPRPSPSPSPSTPEIFEEEPAAAFEGNAQYTGWLRDADGNLVGTVLVKAAKANAKTKVSKLSATVVMLDTGKKLTFNGTAAAGQLANVTLSGKGGPLAVSLTGDSAAGTFGAYTVEAAKNVFASTAADDRVSANTVAKKTWTVTLASAKGYTPFTLAVAAKGKAKVTGVLPDGTKVSVSAQAVVGDGGRWAVPVMYAKKSRFGFVAWFAKGADGQTSLTGVSDLTPLRGPKNAVTEWVAVTEACGPAGSLAAGAHALTVAAADVAAIVPGVNAELLPAGEAVTVAKGKWTLAKAAKVAYKGGAWTVTPAAKGGAAANASAAKLAFTAKTGTFKGSFTAYSVKGGKLAKTKFTVNGAVVDGVAYGTAFNKKVGSVPMVIE